MVKVSPSPPLVWCAKSLRSFINGMPTVHHVQLQKLIGPLTLPCENAVGKTSRFQTEMRLQSGQSLSDRSCRVISFEESGRRLAAQCQQRWWCRNGDALTEIIGDHGGRFNPLISRLLILHAYTHSLTRFCMGVPRCIVSSSSICRPLPRTARTSTAARTWGRGHTPRRRWFCSALGRMNH